LPRWELERFRVGSPTNWPASSKWEEGFDLAEADDRYAGINPCASPLADSGSHPTVNGRFYMYLGCTRRCPRAA